MLMNKFDTEKNWGSKTVSQRFDDQGGLSAVVAIGSEFKKLTVFFDPDAIDTNAKVSSVNGQKMVGLTNDNLALAFHEALHGYGNNIGSLKGNYDDDALTILFYGESKTGGSGVITDYILRKCFN
jgi:hypothetical protein